MHPCGTSMQYPTNQSSNLRVDLIARRRKLACRMAAAAWLAGLCACQSGATTNDPERAVARYAAALEEPESYVQDFEGEDDGLWTPAPRLVILDSEMLPGTQVLGAFTTTDPVLLELSDLPEHSALTVEFDTHVLGEWDGERFDLSSGTWSVATSFSNGSPSAGVSRSARRGHELAAERIDRDGRDRCRLRLRHARRLPPELCLRARRDEPRARVHGPGAGGECGLRDRQRRDHAEQRGGPVAPRVLRRPDHR